MRTDYRALAKRFYLAQEKRPFRLIHGRQEPRVASGRDSDDRSSATPGENLQRTGLHPRKVGQRPRAGLVDIEYEWWDVRYKKP